MALTVDQYFAFCLQELKVFKLLSNLTAFLTVSFNKSIRVFSISTSTPLNIIVSVGQKELGLFQWAIFTVAYLNTISTLCSAKSKFH